VTSLAALRHQRILALLAAKDYVTVAEVRAATGVSMATTHRDLAALAAVGLLTRIHGGAARRHAFDRPPRQLVTCLSRACDALDRDDLTAVEEALRQALAALRP
jgi:DeoR/GlpR family transcriptional regulator of sugar metabolism